MTRRRTSPRVCLWLIALLVSTGVQASGLRVIYPRPESTLDPRADYPFALLRIAMQHSGIPCQLQPAAVTMQQDRSLRELANGTGLDVVWSVATRERDRELLPIRIPIDRGLIGWRVLLIRANQQPRMDTVHTLTDLGRLHAGQGLDWPDLAVLRANGLPTVASPTYEGLFVMLQKGRIDYVPRSIAEVTPELAHHPGMHLAIEKHLLLHYPSALYFYVNKRNTALAKALTLGLERAIADGSMQALFKQTYGMLDAELHLRHRRRLELSNPLFPDDAMTDRQNRWFHLGTP